MANDNTPNGVMSTQEQREMQTALQFSTDSAGEVQRLIHQFENMWGISLWWDSKIPDESWRWYNCVSLTTSDLETVKEISSYLKFYEEMSEISNRINKDEARSEAERKELQTAIYDLREEKLKEMLKKAEEGKETTSSSAAYRLHRGFITNYKKLECMIKDMQLVSLKQVVETANQRIDELGKELEDFDKRYDDLKEIVKKKLAEQKREQEEKLAKQKREQDEKLAELKREQDKKLAEQSEQMSEDKRKFEETLADMVEQNKQLVEQNKQILEHLRIIQENQAKLEDDKRKLEEEKDRLEIENDFLLVMNSSNLQETK